MSLFLSTSEGSGIPDQVRDDEFEWDSPA